MNIPDLRKSPQMDALISMIEVIPNRDNMVEIGSYAGHSTVIFARYFKRVTAVDPWKNGYDPKDACSKDIPMEEVFVDFKYRIHGNKWIDYIKGTSRFAVEEFMDGSLDFVYIDGCHLYEAVKQDLELWIPKIKTSGHIGGHDYVGGWPGVVRAVNEKFTPKVFGDGNWLVRL
jgi:predicted O-methyltransferase YrrM